MVRGDERDELGNWTTESIENTGPYDYLYQSIKHLSTMKRKKPELLKSTQCEINNDDDKNE